MRDAGDVQSAAHDVGGHQQLDLAIPEALQCQRCSEAWHSSMDIHGESLVEVGKITDIQ